MTAPTPATPATPPIPPTLPGGAAEATSTLRRFGRTLVADPRHGPLPVLLLILTAVTGLVDAVSILRLGRVFVANMTGNIMFTAFALAKAPGFALATSLLALLGFLIGAAVGGMLTARLGPDRSRLLLAAAGGEFVLMLTGLGVSLAASSLAATERDILAVLLALAMGIQNAVARSLAVPDLTTTVLTMTLTGIAADTRNRSSRPALLRRLLAVATMLVGGLVGALLVLRSSTAAALGTADGLLLLVTCGAALSTRRPASWRSR
jgi:uncharacterized membrane protein YoaK (UPF0700 family)